MEYRIFCRALMDAYPILFTTEEDCLRHLFFVNGNGLEWVGGELSDGTQTYEEVLLVARSGRYRDSLDSLPAQYAVEDSDPELARTLEIAWRRSLVEDGEAEDCWYIKKDGTIGTVLYPLCSHARILHIPDDVKPDWLRAAQRAYEMALNAKSISESAAVQDQAFLKVAGERIQRLNKVLLEREAQATD